MATNPQSYRTISSSPKTIKILMAADDRNDHLLVLLAANEAGLAIDFTFVDSGDALEAALDMALVLGDTPDLVVVDSRSPQSDWVETVDQLRNHPHSEVRRAPLVVLTATRQGRASSGGAHDGRQWFETMPESFPDLVEFIRTLSRRASPSALARDLLPLTPGRSGPRSGQARRTTDAVEIDLDQLELD